MATRQRLRTLGAIAYDEVDRVPDGGPRQYVRWTLPDHGAVAATAP